MGQKVRPNNLLFVSFEPQVDGFRSLVSMEGLMALEREPADVLTKAAKAYRQAIENMRILLIQIQELRMNRKPIPARKVWQIGNTMFQLQSQLEAQSLQIDRLYEHLERDLTVKRKWLEKAVILRRYLPGEKLIPESMNWGKFEKGTRRVASALRDGMG